MPRGAVADGYDDHPTSKVLRLATLLNHWLHWISAVIVMSIAAYFIAKFHTNTHITYWVTIAAIDVLLYLPALVLPLIKGYKGYLAPLAWIFSYLWLTAFIFASQDYNFNNCAINSPRFVGRCAIKKTLEAFAFLAFFTNLVGLLLEWRLWDKQRFKAHHNGLVSDKARPSGDTTTTAAGAPQTTATTAV